MTLAPPAIRVSRFPAAFRAVQEHSQHHHSRSEKWSHRPFPGLAHLVGQNEDRCVKGRFFGPEAFSPVEHLLPHNANASALEGFFQHTIVMAGLTALAKLEVLSEEPLLEHPTLQLRP